ncbi:MAG: CotH kinase family protein [Cyclobacteriaceae bacterium]|nr:CotH kinase family protein [Cyclobacteriaceae bacterium]
MRSLLYLDGKNLQQMKFNHLRCPLLLALLISIINGMPAILQAQPADFSTDLPLVIVNTGAYPIIKDPRNPAMMRIINNGPGQLNHPGDSAREYYGHITIGIHGESSAEVPKAPYRIELNDAAGLNLDVPLLGMPADDDWIMIAPWSDKSMVRDALSYLLGRSLGQWAPRTRFIELFVNGDYRGVYLLVEKIKQKKTRVPISKLKSTDLAGDSLTGGYILRADKETDLSYPAWETSGPRLAGEFTVRHQFYDPKGTALAPVQRSYIQSFITAFEDALSSASYKDILKGYGPFIDTRSFVDHMIVTELNKNVDGYKFSTYYFKDRTSKNPTLRMGPLWDYNLAFGNVDYWENSQVAPGWMYNDSHRMYWFRRLMSDERFSDAFRCRWHEVSATTFNTTYINAAIDSMVNVVKNAAARNFQKWQIMGTYVWPNQFVATTYDQEIAWLKTWIEQRINWMNREIPDGCPVVTGLPEVTQSASAFPNPSAGAFFFQWNHTSALKQLVIRNPLGQTVHVVAPINESDEFWWDGMGGDGSPAQPGAYLATLYFEDGTQTTIKLIRTSR